MVIVTATKMHDHFGQYLQRVQSGETVFVTKNGRAVARLLPMDFAETPVTDSLTGILRGNKGLDIEIK